MSGAAAAAAARREVEAWAEDERPGPGARGLHSSTFQLNLSALFEIGGARKGCVARVKGVLGGV